MTTNSKYYISAGLSKHGTRTEVNQDRYRLSDKGIVVCDGMGGCSAGEVFAEASCWYANNLLQQNYSIDKIMEKTGLVVKKVGYDLGINGGSSICIIKYNNDNSFDICSKGDILVFRVGDGRVIQINKCDYSNDCKLTSFVGNCTTGISPFSVCREKKLKDYELLTILTDGVWKVLYNNDLVDLLKTNTPLDIKNNTLISLSKKNGSLDDKTAVLCKKLVAV